MAIEMPLFPLNVVLFPGMQLPLHIFEPRYRLMINRCLEADRTFGVALIVEGEEGKSGTLPAPTGCSCEIMETVPFPDGRMNLLALGRRRFRILEMRDVDDYLIGEIEWLDDEPTDIDANEQARKVQDLLRRYLTSLTHNTALVNMTLEDLQIPDDPYALSMWVAALLALPNEQKQHLLGLTSTTTRLEVEHALLHRTELIQRAFAEHQSDSETGEAEEGPFAPFVSLN